MYVVEERTEETRETPIVHISGKMGYSANCWSRLLKESRLLSDYHKVTSSHTKHFQTVYEVKI